MNKNTTYIYIFIVLLTIGTIDSVYGSSDLGSSDFYDKLERDRKLNQIESKIDAARIRSRNQQTRAQNQQIKYNHNNSIVSAHPDYKKIAYGQRFPKWISSMPPKEIIRAKDIVFRGTADEIIQLLSGYKGKYIPPILKRVRRVANSILGKKKKTVRRRRKNYNLMTSDGLNNAFNLIGNYHANRASPEYQADQRKARKAIGMVNKKEILLLLGDYDKLNKKKKDIEDVHYGRIAYVHPDYQEISNDPKFYEYINNLPEEERKICNAIVDGGSSKEVNKLLSAYKQSIGREAEEKGKKGKALQGKTLTNNSRTVSERKDDKLDGKVTLAFPSGNKYVGECKDGKRNGHGTHTWPDGSKYVGSWKNDNIDGQGTYTWANGHKYVGEWKDNKKNGQGTHTWPSGKKYEGKWRDGKFIE